MIIINKHNHFIFLGTPSDIMHHGYIPNTQSYAKRFGYNVNTIRKHIRQLENGLVTHAPKTIIVFDYYLILNEISSLSSYLKIVQKQLIRLLAKYHAYKNIPSLNKLPIMNNMIKHHFDANSLTLNQTFQESTLFDGIHMKKFVMNKIGHTKLVYHTKKQLNKINDNNQLYKIIIHNKHGVISVATAKDIKGVISSVDKQLKLLQIKLHAK